ncbi:MULTISPECIES: hypothetical protein [unclassified Arthrobacter]
MDTGAPDGSIMAAIINTQMPGNAPTSAGIAIIPMPAGMPAA